MRIIGIVMSKNQSLLPNINLPVKTVGIVGIGPRGLSALESLYYYYAKNKPRFVLKTIVFEATENFGNGQVYTQNQLTSNWLNLSNRALTINQRKAIKGRNLTIDFFPSYHQWIDYKEHKKIPDTYAPRAVIGNYLNERFNSIYTNLKQQNYITKVKTTIENIEYKNDVFYLYDAKNTYQVDEVLLTIGHQQIEDDKQLKAWKKHLEKNPHLHFYKNTYPIERILNSPILKKENTIAIRGFGLAMIDLVRAIALANNNKFVVEDEETLKLSITKNSNTPTLVPFSLDGLPMAPKPLNAEIDELFIPSKTDFKKFEENLKLATTEALTIESNNFLTNALAPVIANVFLNLNDKAIKHQVEKNELIELIKNWIINKAQNHFLFTKSNLSALELMKNYTAMAVGKKPITLDYCIGQVWRHCQPTIYKLLSFSNFSEEVIVALIEQDEVHKRLTFGPPVESIQQLIALTEAGILDLSVVNNPKISCTKKGWKLKSNNTEILANIIINSVLDAPQILKVNTPLVKNLLASNYFEPVHSKLGIETLKNGLLNLPNTKSILPIALLGRLAKGTVIGVDAILECFGDRPKYWAKGVIERLQ